MTTTDLSAISTIVEGARASFADGRTRHLDWRISTLQRLRSLIVAHEDRLLAALAADLRKPRLEAWATEIGFVVSDIDHVLAHLPSWTRPDNVATPLAFKPGSSQIRYEPVGVACVIAPWNYPVQLALLPVVAAISAGCAVVLKPSEIAGNTEAALADLIAELDDPAVRVVRGGVAETTELLKHRFGHLLYTGNGRVARIVMRAAAETLTPVTLELGGKSPAIVSRHAKLQVAARRIVWGKFLNAGQTCIAPDYVIVERPVHDELVRLMAEAITEFYGPNPAASPDLARIVSQPQFHRLEKLLGVGQVVTGGVTDADQLYIAPTILTGISLDDPIMQEEIFGPILPIIVVDSLTEATRIVNADDHPLALYVFSQDDAEVSAVLDATTSGGVCVNGTLMHVSNPHLPFGGVGESGTGAYHGRFGFEAFSHRRAVFTRSTAVDPAFLYPPYSAKKEALVRKGLALPDPRDAAASLAGRLRRRRAGGRG